MNTFVVRLQTLPENWHWSSVLGWRGAVR